MGTPLRRNPSSVRTTACHGYPGRVAGMGIHANRHDHASGAENRTFRYATTGIRGRFSMWSELDDQSVNASQIAASTSGDSNSAQLPIPLWVPSGRSSPENWKMS